MSQKIQVLFVDDLSGEAADETVVFSIDGDDYTIDLTTKHAADLRAALQDYTNAARPVGRQRLGRKLAPTSGSEASLIRQWARNNGVPVSDRGRVSARVMETYQAARVP